MILTSTLSNFLSNLKNHSLANKPILKQPITKQILQVVQLLVQEGYLKGYYVATPNQLTVLLYTTPVIRHIQQISKPGKRVYVQNKWLYKNHTSELYILSTVQGFLTQNQALRLNLGGELICKIH